MTMAGTTFASPPNWTALAVGVRRSAGPNVACARQRIRISNSPTTWLAGTRHGRQADVLDLRRDRFQAERSLTSYQALREAATACGVWPAERETALALLSEDMRARPRQPAWAWTGPVLIDVLIDDRDLDAARDAASEQQWLRLADASVDSHPAAALAV